MANRFYAEYLGAITKGLVNLSARVLMSGTTPILQRWQPPAPGQSYGTYVTASAASNGFGGTKGGAEGVASVTRTAQGLWTIVLQDNYQRLVEPPSVVQQLVGGIPNVQGVGLNSTTTDMTTQPGSTIGMALVDKNGAAVDPSDTTIVYIGLLLSNSTAL